MIYLPIYNSNYCVEIKDKDTIRVFENYETSSYTDYFVNSHYLEKTGQVDLNYKKNCSTLDFTTNYMYRNDFPQICFITLCVILLTILPCYFLWKVFYKRG